MAADTFVGRESYLEEFDRFLQGDREGMAPGKGQVLLVVGREGMGKTALLQAMAMRAMQHENPVLVRTVDSRADLSENLLPLIAMIKGKKVLDIPVAQRWLNITAKGFAMLGGWAAKLDAVGKILSELIDSYKKTGGSTETLAEQFSSVLKDWNPDVGGSRRIVFILDSEKQAPEGLVPLLRNLYETGLPTKVRVVVSQRRGDVLIQAYENRELSELCATPMRLDKLEDQEDIEFMKIYGSGVQFAAESLKDNFLEKFGGWPLFMKLALEEIRKIQGQVKEDDIRSLPSDMNGFWKKRYNRLSGEEAFALVDTVCLLPHGYPEPRLAKFAGLSLVEMQVACHNLSVWELLALQPYENALHRLSWDDCPAPQHATCRDSIVTSMSENLKQQRLGTIASHYRETIGTDLDHANVDPDALEHYPSTLLQQGNDSAFLYEVDRLHPIRLRYGLFESILRDGAEALELARRQGNWEHEAVFGGNLGNVYRIRGDLDKAEEMHYLSLKLFEQLNRKEGMANQYGSLGIVYRIRGDLDKAEAMYLRSLELDEQLGHKEGMASQYGNLGNVYLTREELDKAVKMYRMALQLEEQLGRKEGMANQYGNLGNLYLIRRDLDKAEEMYHLSLKLNEQVGRKGGMASDYSNLGNLYLAREEFSKAEEMYRKALQLEEQLDRKQDMASDYGNLGNLYRIRRDLDKAEEMYHLSLELNEQLGHKEGMATGYANLGVLSAERKDLDKTKDFLEKSVRLFEEIGASDRAASVRMMLEAILKP